MVKSRSFPLLIALVATGVLLIIFGPQLAHRWGKNYDVVPAKEPSTGKIKVEEGKVSRRAFGHQAFAPLAGESELQHLDTVQVQNRAIVTLTVGGYSIRISGPALFVLERWNVSNAESPLLIHLISGQLEQLSAGTPGKVYVLRGGEMTDPKGASIPKTRALRVSAVSVGEPAPQPVTTNATEGSSAQITIASPQDSDPGGESLSNEYLDAQIAKEAEQFQRCQSNSLRDQGEVRGQILIGLTISSEGKVAETQILSSSFQDEKLHNCLIQVFRRVQFKPFKGPPIVRSYPLNFE